MYLLARQPLMVSALEVIAIAVLIAIIWGWYQLSSLYKPIPGIPIAPKFNWLMGHVALFLDYVPVSLEYSRLQLGRLYGVMIPFLGPGTMLTDVQDAREVFNNRALVRQCDLTVRTFSNYFGKGLIALQGDTWKKHVRVLGPMLSASRLKESVPIMVAACKELITKWQQQADPQQPYAVEHDFNAVALSIIGEFAFGRKFGSISGSDGGFAAEDEIERHVVTILEAAENGPFENPLIKMIFGNPRKVREARKFFQNLAGEMIEEYRSNPEASSRHAMGQILKAVEAEGVDFSDEELADEMMIILFAGHETTGTSMSWFVKLLASAPQVQAKMRAELDAVLGPCVDPTFDDISHRLPFLDMCFKELMRLSPTGPGTSRSLNHDVVVAGHKLPKDTHVMLPSVCFHHSEEYWVDPERFWPERWEEGEGKGQAALGKPVNPNAWMPFGIGHRACFGSRLATLELKVLLAMVVRNFHFVPTGDAKLDSLECLQRITCKPKYPYVRIQPVPRS